MRKGRKKRKGTAALLGMGGEKKKKRGNTACVKRTRGRKGGENGLLNPPGEKGGGGLCTLIRGRKEALPLPARHGERKRAISLLKGGENKKLMAGFAGGGGKKGGEGTFPQDRGPYLKKKRPNTHPLLMKTKFKKKGARSSSRKKHKIFKKKRRVEEDWQLY